MTRGMEKANVLNNFFPQSSLAKALAVTPNLQKEENWEKEDLPAVREDQAQDHLKHLKVHKSIGPDEIDPQLLRELADKVAKPLSIVLERSWQSSEDPTDWKEKT